MQSLRKLASHNSERKFAYIITNLPSIIMCYYLEEIKKKKGFYFAFKTCSIRSFSEL